MIYNSSNLDYVVEVQKNKCDSFIGIEPYAYLTVVKDLCVIFEKFISTQQPDVFTDLKQNSKEIEVRVEV